MRTVNRRLLTILFPFVAASLAAGCSTFSDNDAAARVNDVELSNDALVEIANFLSEGSTQLATGPGDADEARNVLGIWVQAQALAALRASDDVTLTETERDAATAQLSSSTVFAELSDEVRDTLVDFLASLNGFASEEERNAVIEEAIANADIYVDPRLGAFDPQAGVVPLG